MAEIDSILEGQLSMAIDRGMRRIVTCVDSRGRPKQDVRIPQDKSKREELQIKPCSKVERDEVIYEQVQGMIYIGIHADGSIEYKSQLSQGDITCVPVAGAEIEQGKETVVLPPAKPEPYGSIPELVREIINFVHEWVDLTPEIERMSAWYVLMTWVADRMPSLNYLSFMGDTGTGKSRAQDTIGRLCYRATHASGAVSVAALKRIVERWRGTLIIDEGDFRYSDETAELIKLLNLGFEKNRRMFSCDKDNPEQIQFFDPFGPKIIGRRRHFQDQALEARCITEVMRQTQRRDIRPILTKKFYLAQDALRRKLLQFRIEWVHRIDSDKVAEIDLGRIEPRLKQATLAFAALFANIPDVMEEFRSFLQRYQGRLVEERGESFDGQIVNQVADHVRGGNAEVGPSDIQVMNARGQPVNVRTIGKHLRQLGFEVKKRRVDGVPRSTIIIDKNFLAILERYCSPEVFQDVLCVPFVPSLWSTSPPMEQGPVPSKCDVDHTMEQTAQRTIQGTPEEHIIDQKNPSENLAENQIIEEITRRGGKIDKQEFCEKYGENRCETMLATGELSERKAGWLEVAR